MSTIKLSTVITIILFSGTVWAKISKKDLSDAKKMLQKAEQIRAPDEGKSYVTLTSQNAKKVIDYQLEVLIGDRKTALVEFMEPPIEKGRRLLMKEGQYFAKFRHSKSAVPISRREALGNSTFALADIFRLELTDYDITKMNRQISEGEKKLIELDLKAKNKNVPYDRVLYYMDAKDQFPAKAKFFGVSGKHLKTLYVEGRKKYNGTLRASIVRMDD